MHILMRRSLLNPRSHALAWHTTFLSLGCVSIERSQNVAGSGSSPIEVKNASPVFTIFTSSYLAFLSALVMSRLASPGYGSIHS
jgi:hypothetical protein